MANSNKKRIFFILLLPFILVLTIYLFSISSSFKSNAWYNSGWMYRVPIAVGNVSGSTLTNEDVVMIIDTSALVSGGKMQTDCDDIRLVDGDDTTLLTHWRESSCNTTSTKIWARIPSLPNGGKTIYLYYGNPSAANSGQTWAGNISMFADTTCPAGWTRNTAFDNKFLYGSATYGSTGGSDTHGHANVSGTSSSISTTNVGATVSGSQTGTTTTHTHTSLQAAITTGTVLPAYANMILCYNTSFSLPTGIISMFNTSTPGGWTRFTALDSKYPRGAATYGGTGGNPTHSHTTTTGYTSGGPTGTQTSLLPFIGSGGSTSTYGSDTIHTFSSTGTFTTNQAGTVTVLVIAGGGGGGNAGGGGAGGLIYNTSFSVGAGNTSVTVGTGGGGGISGTNSVFSSLTAVGGGAGGAFRAAGLNGGSGGGGSTWDAAPGTGTAGQGYSGGYGAYAAGGGGGGAGGAGTNASGENGNWGGHGGIGVSNSITGTATWYAGGGAARGSATGGCGNPNSGGTACETNATNIGAGGGGGDSLWSGANGRVFIRYATPATSLGSVASSVHTHNSTSATPSTVANDPPYLQMVFAKANSATYMGSSNVIITSVLPPLGWTRFTALDSKFPMGAAAYGGTGGTATHTHSVSISTGGPSATLTAYGSGTNYADTTHTHSVSVSSGSGSNLPAYYSVIYAQRKASQSTTPQSEEMYNQVPSAPGTPYSEDATNPSKVYDLQPEFSAVFSDPDATDTGNYYQIEVNTNNTFTGTVMWDSSLLSMTPVTNNTRSGNIEYALTNLNFDGTTYYWRIRFGDNYGSVSNWSTTQQFTMANLPVASNLLTETATNPVKVLDLTPEFSATFTDADAGETGTYYQIQVNTQSDFNGTSMWDSTKILHSPAITNGACSTQISYAGTALTANGLQYYWRIKFWDNNGIEGNWSSTANFRMSGVPNTPTDLLVDGKTNPVSINSLTPIFSAIHSDPNTDNATHYEIEVNASSLFNGTVMWDTGQTATTVTNGSRSPNYTYAGTALTGTSRQTYYWRIRFWDGDGLVSNWSTTATFVDTQAHLFMDGLQLDGLQIQ